MANEDRPLFPNVAYSYSHDPRLAYWFNNQMVMEHIPKPTSRISKQIARKKMIWKWNKDKKLTYTDMQVIFSPDTTKIHDLEFLFHCFDAHDGPPTDLEEKKLYDLLYPLYRIEIGHLAQMMHFPALEKLNIANPRKKLNPLYIAYKQRWFGLNPVTEFQKVFHGVTYDEYQKIVNKQYEHLEKTKRKKSKKTKSRQQKDKNIDESIINASKHS